MRMTAFKEINGIKSKIKHHGLDYDYWSYRMKWRLAPRVHFVTRFPTHLDIELTNACNLRCVMCPHGFPTPEFKKTLGFMDEKLLINLIDEGAEKGLCSIKFNWRGEALLHKKLAAKAVSYAKSKGIVEVALNTNGLLLDEEMSAALIESGLDLIIFSIDGNSKATYEQVRKGGDFDRMLSNVYGFLKMREEKKRTRDMQVRVQMVKMDHNIHEVQDFLNRWRPLVDSISFQDYTNRGEQDERLKGSHVSTGRLPCPQIWQRMVVAWDGKVIMCCRDWDSKNLLGIIDYDSGKNVEYFWHGEELKRIRKFHLEKRLNEVAACKDCQYKESYNWKRNGNKA
ncbi:MAG: radical SAM protein [Nitrospirae bacterium]|nr:radical SAM protein [Nitrospirota bacterium]